MITWVFPKIVVPQNGWFILENLIKMDDLGGKPTIFGNIHMDPKKGLVAYGTRYGGGLRADRDINGPVTGVT